jgi:hypothetical protein
VDFTLLLDDRRWSAETDSGCQISIEREFSGAKKSMCPLLEVHRFFQGDGDRPGDLDWSSVARPRNIVGSFLRAGIVPGWDTGKERLMTPLSEE